MIVAAPACIAALDKPRNPQSHRCVEQEPVSEAPQWLKARMAALRMLPPPTMEEVEASFRASEKWVPDDVRKIQESDYIR